MRKVLILYTGSSCRSQIAEGYLRRAAIYSAGVEVHDVNPPSIHAMKEDGSDN